MSVPDDPTLDLGTSFTASLWVVYDDTDTRSLLGKGRDTSSTHSWQISTYPGDYPRIALYDGTLDAKRRGRRNRRPPRGVVADGRGVGHGGLRRVGQHERRDPARGRVVGAGRVPVMGVGPARHGQLDVREAATAR